MQRFRITITLGALLIFALQPLMGKTLLPWFGGGPSVWSACMLFFQSLLLAGYAYAHFIDARLRPKAQAGLHLVGLALAGLVLLMAGLLWDAPILPAAILRPTDSTWPALRILGILSLSVGLPFFLLSSTGPLLQAWFRRLHPADSPYPLYALSNLGSLAALLAYPFLLEPLLNLSEQAWLWTAAFFVFVLGMARCAWPLLRRPEDKPAAGLETPSLRQSESIRQRLEWLALSATGSALLLAATNQICMNVAVIPFLWVLPLALYLLSFVLCFHDLRLAARGFWAPLFGLSSLAVVAMLFHGAERLWRLGSVNFELGLSFQVALYSLNLLSACMLVHGELVRSKPPAARLTSFYLWISAGGAAGGLFVSLLAPALFNGLWEFHLSLAAVAALSLAAWWREAPVKLGSAGLWSARAALLSAVAGLMLLLLLHPLHLLRESIHAERNFYGVLRVLKKNEGIPQHVSHDLYDGQILHGYQLQSPELKTTPTSYYSRQSGLGLLMAHHPRRPAALKVGLVGLGLGTAAALGRPGDELRFYEINPAVIRLARGQAGLFSFLSDSPAEIRIVEGDARLQLEREQEAGASERFDLLVVDAFQSDAIPVHLITREALQLFLSQLRPDGALLLHVTNVHLNLEPVLDRLAQELGLAAAVIRHAGDGWVSLLSRWMLLTRDAELLSVPAIAEQAQLPEQLETRVPLWTDDHSSLLPILR